MNANIITFLKIKNRKVAHKPAREMRSRIGFVLFISYGCYSGCDPAEGYSGESQVTCLMKSLNGGREIRSSADED